MTSMLDKLYGAEAAAAAGSSMGDLTAALAPEEIADRYGVIEEPLPQPQKWAGQERRSTDNGSMTYHVHDRPAGMTDAGHERHRLMVSAIIEKGAGLRIEDLADVWLRDIDVDRFGYLLSPEDEITYLSLQAGVPPWEVGRFSPSPGSIATARMMLPVGLVNPGDSRAAARSARDLGQLKDIRGQSRNYGVAVGAAVAAGAAAAMPPDASVQTVTDAVLEALPRQVAETVERTLELADGATDWHDLSGVVGTPGDRRHPREAVETLASAMALFHLADGDPEQAVVSSVNLGSGSDARAYVAGGLAGALRGIDAVPSGWVEVLSQQVIQDPYTVSRRTPLEAAQGLYGGLMKAIDHGVEQLREVRWAFAEG